MPKNDRTAAEDAAFNMVRRGLELGVLETSEPDGLRAEIAAALAPFEEEDSLPPENKRRELIERLGELMIESPHVTEVFADDAMLHRVVAAALFDYARRLERNARDARADGVLPLRPRAKAPRRVTLAEEGFAFPLFAGTRGDAVLDEAGLCRACRVSAPTRFEGHCYDCFRKGLAEATRDTEHGMVRPEDAAQGLTHGKPAGEEKLVGLEVVTVDDGEGGAWWRVRLEREGLEDLLRTPDYRSAQGSSWLVCCRRPMMFLGALDEAVLEELGERDEKTSEEVLASMLGIDEDEAEEKLDEVLRHRVSAYGFRCSTCERERAYTERA